MDGGLRAGGHEAPSDSAVTSDTLNSNMLDCAHCEFTTEIPQKIFMTNFLQRAELPVRNHGCMTHQSAHRHAAGAHWLMGKFQFKPTTDPLQTLLPSSGRVHAGSSRGIHDPHDGFETNIFDLINKFLSIALQRVGQENIFMIFVHSFKIYVRPGNPMRYIMCAHTTFN